MLPKWLTFWYAWPPKYSWLVEQGGAVVAVGLAWLLLLAPPTLLAILLGATALNLIYERWFDQNHRLGESDEALVDVAYRQAGIAWIVAILKITVFR